MNKSKQGDNIVALAIYGILKFQNNAKPERWRVLKFIELKKLIKLREDDLEEISPNQTRLENRLSWNRKHLEMHGIITAGREYYGIWRLPPEKIEKIKELCLKTAQKYEQDPELFAKLSGPGSEYTVHFLNLVLQIARNDFSRDFYPVETSAITHP